MKMIVRTALLSVLAVAIFPAFAAVEITDLPDTYWARVPAGYLVENEIMSAPSGKFDPEHVVTRGEMVGIVLRQTGTDLLEPTRPTFSDVPSSHPAFSAIETAFAEKIVAGFEDGTFRPDALVTRAQFLKILFTANETKISLTDPGNDAFSDVPATHWAFDFVNFSRAQNLVRGFGDGSFRPDDPLTRAAIAKIIFRFLEVNGEVKSDVVLLDTDDRNASEQSVDQLTAEYERFVLAMINISRKEIADLPPLVFDPEVATVARDHARWLAAAGKKADHDGENDSTPFDRLKSAGIDYSATAENIAWASSNTRSVAATLFAVHEGMMKKSDDEVNHRTNILGRFYEFGRVGIGVDVSDTAEGREVRIVEVFIAADGK